MKPNFERTAQVVLAEINANKAMGWPFIVRHGTYTTKIETPINKTAFSTVQFRRQVFTASAMVKRDVMRCPDINEILSTEHYTRNYSNSDCLHHYESPRVLNIDIKGAYPRCMFRNNLISEQTYNFLLNLGKSERLPAIGMLAKSHLIYYYEEGQLKMVDKFRSDTAEVFFFLIQEIDRLMREIKFMLGRYFIYYWVDGVFFMYDTPNYLIEEIESYLTSEGYEYSYEMVENFVYDNTEGKCKITLEKDGKLKEWNFRDIHENESAVRRAIQEGL